MKAWLWSHKELLITCLVLSVAGYLLVGDEGLLAGLLRLLPFLNTKKSQARADTAKAEAGAHEEMMQHEVQQAQAATKEAEAIREEVIKDAEDITAPKDPPKPGYIRKHARIK